MISNIVFMFGEETFLLEETLKRWKDAFKTKYEGDTNIDLIEGKGLKAQILLQTCKTLPFLSEKRMVIVENFLNRGSKDEQKLFTKLFDKIPESCVLIFKEDTLPDKRGSLFKKLNKESRSEEFIPLKGVNLNKWIEEKTLLFNGKISHSTADYLAQAVGGHLWQLNQEIQKLSLFSLGREISKEDIDLLTNANLQTSIFKLTDALAQKRSHVSLKILSDLLYKGEELHMIFHMIIRQFRILIQLKSEQEKGTPSNQIASLLKIHPFVVKNTLPQTRNFSLENLKIIYQKLLQIEVGSKTGIIKSFHANHSEFRLAL